jgi:hypothetical protein
VGDDFVCVSAEAQKKVNRRRLDDRARPGAPSKVSRVVPTNEQTAPARGSLIESMSARSSRTACVRSSKSPSAVRTSCGPSGCRLSFAVAAAICSWEAEGDRGLPRGGEAGGLSRRRRQRSLQVSSGSVTGPPRCLRGCSPLVRMSNQGLSDVLNRRGWRRGRWSTSAGSKAPAELVDHLRLGSRDPACPPDAHSHPLTLQTRQLLVLLNTRGWLH